MKPSCFYNGCRYCWLIQSLLSDDCCDVIQIQIVNSILQFFSIFFRMQFHLIGEFFLVKVCDVLLSLWVESNAVCHKILNFCIVSLALVVHSISFKTNNSVYQLSTSPRVFVTEPKPISKSRQTTWHSKKCTLKPAKYLEILQRHKLLSTTLSVPGKQWLTILEVTESLSCMFPYRMAFY